MSSNDPAVSWLLTSRDPSVRYLTLTEILGNPARDSHVLAARRAIPKGAKVRALLSGQRRDGGFGVHPYSKWTGGFWRLVALAELAMPPGDPRIRPLADHVLAWLEGHRRGLTTGPVMIGTLVRAHATQDGFALAAFCLLGMARSHRVRRLTERIIDWQWPDGGWNCDRNPDAKHSSFHETHGPLWGLAEFHRTTGDRDARQAVLKASKFLLQHRLFRSENTGKVIHDSFLKLRFPPYWHYDVLQGLWVLSRAGALKDGRAGEGIDLIAQKRRPDGKWRAGGYYWNPPGGRYHGDVVDWGRGGPSEWVTLRALRVLKAAGRLEER